MSPRIERLESWPETIVASVGGKAIIPEGRPLEIDCVFIEDFKKWSIEQVAAGKSIIAVIGGGELARVRKQNEANCGVTNRDELDKIGIGIANNNARLIRAIFRAAEINTVFHRFKKEIKPRRVYVRGGKGTGHTTDYVAVQAAHEIGCKLLLNISLKPGLLRVVNGQLDTDHRPIPSISWERYLEMFKDVDQTPGVNIPFDKPASMLAQKYDMTVILLGKSFENIRNCLSGKEFEGTIIHR